MGALQGRHTFETVARELYASRIDVCIFVVPVGEGQGGPTAQETAEPRADGGAAQAESGPGRAARYGSIHCGKALLYERVAKCAHHTFSAVLTDCSCDFPAVD